MIIEVLETADLVARQAAAIVAKEARAAVDARGRFIMAVSGGTTPWQMLRALAGERVPWDAVQIVQVDERVAPAGDPDRNLTHLRESLLSHAPLKSQQIHAMPVESPNLESAATSYAELLHQISGSPPVLDLVHLGLGPDGHTASLVPGDPVLDVTSAGRRTHRCLSRSWRRMTLTYLMDQSGMAEFFGWSRANRRHVKCWCDCARGRSLRFRPAGLARSRPRCWPTGPRPRRRGCNRNDRRRCHSDRKALPISWSRHGRECPPRTLWRRRARYHNVR